MNIWKTLPIATFASIEAMMEAFKNSGIILSWYAGQLCKKITQNFALPSGPVDVSVVTHADLGITEGTVPIRYVYERALAKGYRLCTPEIGMLARLAYTSKEQINNPTDMWWIAIAMEPIAVEGKLHILRIAAGTMGSRLNTWEVEKYAPQSESRDKWLFVSPK